MKMLLTCTLAAVLLSGTAFAQSSSSSSGQTVGSSSGSSGARSYDRNVNGTRDIDGNPKTIDSVVGAPAAGAQGETPLDKENRRLDKMINNICRGC